MLGAVNPELQKNLGRLVLVLFYGGLLAGLALLTSHPALRDEATIVPSLGPAKSVEIDEGDAVFQISHQLSRYRIAGPDSAVIAALHHSLNSGNSLALRVHMDGARFGEYSDTPEYWIESVEYLGKTHGPYRAHIRWSWRDISDEQAGLLRGVGLENAWRYEEAVKALDIALSDDGLSDGKLAIAYQTRGSALESLAYPDHRDINDRDDALLLRALEDFRRAAQLDPSDYRNVHWQAGVAASLGGYREALALYEDVRRRWPDQYFRVAIARGATYRQMGEFDDALRELDTLVAAHGPQKGMMFHYHRGATLNKLARYAEAAKDFTAGLENQPDFPWAFVGRACAEAQQGDIAHAVEDQRHALELVDRKAKLDSKVAVLDRRDGMAKVLQDLEAAQRSAPETPSAAGCAEFFTGPQNMHRERSPLFKSAAATVTVE